MWMANVERVQWYFVPESCMQIVSCIYKKRCSALCSGKKHLLHYTGACSCREIGNCRQRYAQHFLKFQIKIMSSFKSKQAWFHEILHLYRYCISFISKFVTYKHVTCINMFIFSLNRLAPCRSEGDL